MTLIRRDPASEYDLPPSPPPTTWREHLRYFVQAAAVTAVVVLIACICARIGAGR